MRKVLLILSPLPLLRRGGRFFQEPIFEIEQKLRERVVLQWGFSFEFSAKLLERDFRLRGNDKYKNRT